MTDQPATGTATPAESASDLTNVSPENWTFRRAKELEARAPKAPPAKPTATPEEETPAPAAASTPETENESQEQPEGNDDVLSKIDLDSLSEQQLHAIADKLKSRAISRYGELTAKARSEAERVKQLQEELDRVRSEIPKAAEQNPYAAIKTPDELAAIEQQSAEVLDWADDVLAVNELAGANDPVFDRHGRPIEYDGKQWTKLMVRDAMRNAKNALAKHLPSQRKVLEATTKREELKNALLQQAQKELPWLAKDDDPAKKGYEELLNAVGIEQIEASVPDAAPRLRHALAHAANSIYARKVVENSGVGASAPKKPSLTPPSNPSSGAARSSSPEARVDAQLKEALMRYQQTGSESDFVKLRTLQRNKRV